MSDLPRRGNLPRVLSQGRFGPRSNLSETSIDTTAVLSSSALPQMLTYSMSERSLDETLGTPSKNAKYTPPLSPRSRDSAPVQDSFRAISRAIHNLKIRTGARMSALAAKQRLARSTTRTYFLYVRAAQVLFFIMLMTFAVYTMFNANADHTGHSSFRVHDFFRAICNLFVGSNMDDRERALKQLLRHRPSSITTRHFDTGPWVIAAITDEDKESCRFQEKPGATIRTSPCGKANTWVSYFKRGILRLRIPSKGHWFKNDLSGNSIEWLDETELYRHGRLDVEQELQAYGGRGMELSELEWFHGHLLTPDDRTGILLEIVSPRGQLDSRSQQEFYGAPSNVAPSMLRRATLLDGPGNDSNAAFKAEWMVVKDDSLVVGGHGRSYTDPGDGTRIKNHNPKWVKTVDSKFRVSHVNWAERYDAVAKAAGISFPGYLMHEAVLWSEVRRQWVFLPRRKSDTPFAVEENERRGWNFVIFASEDFKDISTLEIKGLHDLTGLRGFSSAKFVPGTSDRVVAAIRTIEVESHSASEERRETASFLSVFDLSDGSVVLPEQKFSAKKFEGLVFL